MILAIDIGNSSIMLGVFDGARLTSKGKLSTARGRSADEYAALMMCIFEKNKVDTARFDGAILLSVVPSLTHVISDALASFKIKPIIVGAGIKTGLNIRTETPGTLGTDIVAGTVAAMRISKPPLIVADLGTATTLTAINQKEELCGCIIAPGAKISLDAMTEACSQLNDIALSQPKALLGKNTAESINSGVVMGNAIMLDGFIRKIKAEYGFDESTTVIATGGLSALIVPLCESKIQCEPDLTLHGLNYLYLLNKNKVKQ